MQLKARAYRTFCWHPVHNLKSKPGSKERNHRNKGWRTHRRTPI